MDETLPVPVPVPDSDPTAAVVALAARYKRARGPVMSLVQSLGGKIENRMEALPDSVKARIETVAEDALRRSYGLAAKGRAAPDLGERGHLAIASLAGAAGGLGGLPTALAELPVTVTVIFHAIQKVAEAHGFDPDDPQIRAEALRVFAAGSPLAEDDGVNTTFLGARLTITGPALNRLIAAVAPRLATVLGQKLAAQAVPVLGAAAGAALNYAFLAYYRELAHVRFGLLRLVRAHDPQRILAAFAEAVGQPGVPRA